MRQLHGWFAQNAMNLPYLLLPADSHGPIPAPVLANSVIIQLCRHREVSGQHGTICREIMLGNHPLGHRRRIGRRVDWLIRDGT